MTADNTGAPFERVGWIGMGDQGEHMALRVAAAGHPLTVWGRTQSRLAPALERGARNATSPADLASTSDVVCLCVYDTDAVEDVVFGANGIAAGARPGMMIVDHSTIDPVRSRVFATRMREAHGVAWVDAPVSGGNKGAAEGTLTIFAGGEDADFARVRPLMERYGKVITHMGLSGAGQVTKLCNQTVMFATLAGWAETINFARRSGLDPVKVVDALAGGLADSNVRRLHAGSMAAGTLPDRTIEMPLKDLGIIESTAAATNTPMFITGTVTALLRLLKLNGRGTGGLQALARVYEEP